jgi:pyridinium-3,5-bisthiocarboxylic acid mononucleotide nickel chelatase
LSHDVKHARNSPDLTKRAYQARGRIAYLDCFSGISGDMFLGALIDAGVPPEIFLKTVAALNLGAALEINRVTRSGISATKVDVVVDGSKEQPRGWAIDQPRRRDLHAQSHPQPHSHSHPHTNESHPHDHHDQGYAPFEHFHTHSSAHGRTLDEIRHIIDHLKSSQSARRLAISVFEKLGTAEAKVHNVPIEKIHFHEVGAVDAIVDIVCAAVGAEALGVEQFICSPLNLGGGSIECAHGVFPVPAPATVELLKKVPVYSSGVRAELVTPTGAAIVTTIASRFESFPAMKIEKTGYGAGSHDFPGQPNVTRIVIGEFVQALDGDGSRTRATQEDGTITVVEANLDDLNPQVFGYVMEQLFQAGALDVFGTPVQMKKNRPGTLLTVLANRQDADKLVKIIFAETTTLGVRRREEQRQILARAWQTVSTRFGEIRIKVASMNGTVSSYAPEYEDCRRIATEQRVPLKQVMQEAVQAYLQVTSKKP